MKKLFILANKQGDSLSFAVYFYQLKGGVRNINLFRGIPILIYLLKSTT